MLKSCKCDLQSGTATMEGLKFALVSCRFVSVICKPKQLLRMACAYSVHKDTGQRCMIYEMVQVCQCSCVGAKVLQTFTSGGRYALIFLDNRCPSGSSWNSVGVHSIFSPITCAAQRMRCQATLLWTEYSPQELLKILTSRLIQFWKPSKEQSLISQS